MCKSVSNASPLQDCVRQVFRFKMIELPTILVPEIRLNSNHIAFTFRVPYWLVGVTLTVLLILGARKEKFELFLVTTIATCVFWYLNRIWPYRRDKDGGLWQRCRLRPVNPSEHYQGS